MKFYTDQVVKFEISARYKYEPRFGYYGDTGASGKYRYGQVIRVYKDGSVGVEYFVNQERGEHVFRTPQGVLEIVPKNEYTNHNNTHCFLCGGKLETIFVMHKSYNICVNTYCSLRGQ